MNTFSTSLSGIQTAFRRQEVSAHNLANLNTDGYRARRTHQEEDPTGGVQTTLRQAGQNEQPQQGSNVSPAREVVEQTASEHMNSANLAAVKTRDEMLGALMDLQA